MENRRTMRQVITVSPEGGLSGLQVKPGKGVDLRQFGQAKIVRASEIVFSEDHQMWTVEILVGVYRGCTLGHSLLTLAEVSGLETRQDASDGDTFLYLDYDVAVQDEIAFLDAVRVADIHSLSGLDKGQGMG